MVDIDIEDAHSLGQFMLRRLRVEIINADLQPGTKLVLHDLAKQYGMAAGGAMAIEDAAIFSRCLSEFSDPKTAFARYTATRIPRVAEVQRISAANTWMREATDIDWFFEYDLWLAPLNIDGN